MRTSHLMRVFRLFVTSDGLQIVVGILGRHRSDELFHRGSSLAMHSKYSSHTLSQSSL